MSALTPHPATTDPILTGVSAEIVTTPSGWRLTYRLADAAGRLLIPPPATPAEADSLWQHTCCEAFVGVPGSRAYREFNFSPSGQWAVYAFTDTRQRDAGYRPDSAPRIECRATGAGLELSADLDRDLLPAGQGFRIGLSVVAEAANGSLAYWALSHPAPQPDFHHPDAFVLNLESPA